jgi:hypothetical protein
VAKLNKQLLQRKQRSGQVILIAVLAMALILLSAQVYVFDVQMSTFSLDSNSLSDYLAAIKLGSRNVVAGSLANISNNGAGSILAVNLDRWATLIGMQSQFGKSTLTYIEKDSSPYSSGIWLSLGTQGYGVSSSVVHFVFNLSDREVDADLSYAVNVTTTLSIEGVWRTILGDEKQVNITISVMNEDKPALAQQITLYYRLSTSWLAPNASNNYTVMDYGNGTYLASFSAGIPSSSVEVFLSVIDQRQVLVKANATCIQV